MPVTPGAITVTFNKPVNFSTITADPNPSDILHFVSTPSGVTVLLGQPIPVVDANNPDPTRPRSVQFPLQPEQTRAGRLANGNYSFVVQNPPSRTARSLRSTARTSSPAPRSTSPWPTSRPPQVAATSVFGRIVTITFTKAIDPSTITLANIYVQRANGGSPINLNTVLGTDGKPLAKISSSLNSAGQTVVTLDYRALPQTAMPTDSYDIIANGCRHRPGGQRSRRQLQRQFPLGRRDAGQHVRSAPRPPDPGRRPRSRRSR